MNQVIKILMERDGMSKEEAREMVRDAKLQVYEGADPEEVLEEMFGLEPDYIYDIM